MKENTTKLDYMLAVPKRGTTNMMKTGNTKMVNNAPVIAEKQTLKVPPKHIDIITEFTIDADYPVVVLIDMQPDWVSISHSGNLRPVMKATVSQSIPKDTQVETIETPTNPQNTQGEQTT